jgi:sialate O-acetylesterase
MSKRLLLPFLFLLTIFAGCHKTDTGDIENNGGSTGKLSVASVLQSNMVIQRDKPCPIWGQAIAGQKVTVTASWNATVLTAVADDTGTWKVNIPASAANNLAQTIVCSTDGAANITLSNILTGDVWICSGQSNMVMQMDAITPFTGVLDYQTEIAAANYPAIRALTIKEDYKSNPVTNLSNAANWTVCSPQTAGSFSGVAYYFARKLHTTLNVPVGIIISAINGSWCESWISKDAFTCYPEIYKYIASNNATQLYNGMISPLVNLQIKGFIWYQGENNQKIVPVGDYTKLNTALINSWRTIFNQGQLPFYLVQLTPFAEDYNTTTPIGGSQTDNWLGYFREAQTNVTQLANTGIAITMDVGEAANHHPRNKKPVGERLGLLALKNTYNQDVICDGPKYAGYTLNGSTATITFLNSTSRRLNTINSQPLNQLFFVAGTDKIFRQGYAQIVGNTITVTAPSDMPSPIQAIRYAFTNVAITNLQNDSALPMEPFRTDGW